MILFSPPIGQTPIPDIRSADPFCLPFPRRKSGFLRLHQTAFGIIVDSKEGETRKRGSKDHDHHPERKNRVQPPERSHGEDDRAEPDRPSLSGRVQGIINHSGIQRGGRNHEEDRSQRQGEIREEGGQGLAGSHVHPGEGSVGTARERNKRKDSQL